MINPHNVLNVLSRLTFDNLFSNSPSVISVDEEHIAFNLYKCLNSILESTCHMFETETTLDHDDELDDQDSGDLLPSTFTHNYPDTVEDADYEPIDELNLQNHFSLDYMNRVVECFDEIDPNTGKRKRKWKTIKHLFRRVPNPKCIACFRNYIEAGGTKKQQMDNVDIYVDDQFEHARHQYLSVYDIDLRRWSLKKARELNLNDFQASECWLGNVVENQEEIKQSAKTFVLATNKIIEGYGPNPVLNTEHIGIELEPHGDSTLTHSGERSPWSSVRSLGAATHSYTIQPIITMEGSVSNPLYICLKEVSGHISENLKKNLFNAKNIVLTCSKSGKLTSSLVTYWRDQCLIPNLRSRTLLLVDSLPHQVHPEVYKGLKHFEHTVIPPKTTSMIQPLDVYYNRQHKKIVRRIYDHIRLNEIDINLSERNNLIKLQ
ncbi:unnamed protein product [Rotaria sp. Silwood2]|nr:unnamed protein product [Rotaria sp. Silwood2]CAF2932028.1 unnamed protein product [Rotaria sp. Silwood2]CAF3186862.1 unnamed protein product [Rotaria sp. Silwood2]CAF3407577.1 unnamed protein product [Rotaria sp. Silwood2]CAF4057050.1 unnamed protein product [Rotaria sp. Silwood2]